MISARRLAAVLALMALVVLPRPAPAQPASGPPAWYEDRQCGFRFPLPKPWVFTSRVQSPYGPVSTFTRPDWPAFAAVYAVRSSAGADRDVKTQLSRSLIGYLLISQFQGPVVWVDRIATPSRTIGYWVSKIRSTFGGVRDQPVDAYEIEFNVADNEAPPDAYVVTFHFEIPVSRYHRWEAEAIQMVRALELTSPAGPC